MEDKATRLLGKTTLTNFAFQFCGIINQWGYKAGVYVNIMPKHKLLSKC